MNNELQLAINQSGLEKNKIDTLLSNFGDYFKKAKVIADKSKSIVVTDEQQSDLMQEARFARLELKNIRCDVENTRKELKEQSLREGKAIDGIANVIKALIIPVEEHLEKQEKFIEILEAKRKAERLTRRQEELSKYKSDISFYNLNDMSDEAFNKLLADSKASYEAQKEAERKAEEERIAREKKEAEEREKIRLENEKLRKEAEIREKKLAEERRKAEEARRKQEEILRKEREAKAKLEAELKAKQEAEEKAKREEEERKAKIEAEAKEAERQKQLAPDKTKLLELAKAFEAIVMPEVQNENAKQTVNDVVGMVGRLSTFIKKRANNL